MGGVTVLRAIQDEVQRVVEAVAAALGLEVEIVDEELTIVGGTGKYTARIGAKEEAGRREDGYLYGRVLTTGEHFIVPNPGGDPGYDPSVRLGTTDELAEICCPIRLEGRIIGVIGLVAFDAEQRRRMLTAADQMLAFVQRMADLLAGRVQALQAHRELLEASGRLEAIIGAMHDGVLSVQRSGEISHCNDAAAGLLGLGRDRLVGRRIEEVMPGTGISEVLATGQGYVEREELFHLDGRTLQLVVTAMPITGPQGLTGAVAVFRDIGQVRRLVYNLALESRAQSFDDLKGESPGLREVIRQARRIASSPATVLITGESGTGKDLLARAIHHAGPRRGGPFIAVNCGALPEHLLESELFGYAAGAFTGARRDGKPGRFELADGGTLFLDEIGDLPLHLQVKLLHVLQRREVERVGGIRPVQVDVRVIAATNRDLAQMVQEGQFRPDLYFRLNVIPLQMPPLRERPEDLPVLLQHFLQVHAARLGRPPMRCSRAVQAALARYGWPGNVRELENAVEYAVNVATEDEIRVEHLPPWLLRSLPGLQAEAEAADAAEAEAVETAPPAAGHLPAGPLRRQVADLERRVLAAYLEAYGRNGEALAQVARALGLSRATLYRKLKALGLLDSR